jgi:hypothetical protein
MPKRNRAEIDSDKIDSFFDLILNASGGVDISSANDSEKKIFLNTIKEQILSDLSEAKEKSKAATDFTLSEAIETFGLKYVQTLDKYQQDHTWDIEKDVGEVEFPITPCIGETLMPSC